MLTIFLSEIVGRTQSEILTFMQSKQNGVLKLRIHKDEKN